MKRGFLFVFLFLFLLLNGCSAPASGTERLITPLESAQIAAVDTLDAGDRAALETFFGRWGAYAAVVSEDAQDEEDIYSTLMDYSWTWKQAVTQAGGVEVLLYLPATVGFLQVDAEGGIIREADVSYDSENTDVRSTLAFTVACNALIYALSTNSDMSAAAAVYNTCMTRLNESGAEMEGSVVGENYTFILALNPADHMMHFSAVANLAA